MDIGETENIGIVGNIQIIWGYRKHIDMGSTANKGNIAIMADIVNIGKVRI